MRGFRHDQGQQPVPVVPPGATRRLVGAERPDQRTRQPEYVRPAA